VKHPSNFGYVLPPGRFSRYQGETALPALHLAGCGFIRDTPAHGITRTGIDDAILIYCVAGRGRLKLGRSWPVGPGDLFVIPPRVPHGYGSDPADPWRIHWAHFQGSSCALLFERLGLSVDHPLLEIGKRPDLARLFARMRESVLQGYTVANFDHASSSLLSILTLLQRTHGQSAPLSRREGRFNPEPVIAVMRSSMGVTMALDNLAARFDLSPWHFSRRFRAATGFAPMDYFVRLKVQRACEELSRGSEPIHRIALGLGFEDALYFSRVFRRVCGMAPREYRERFSESGDSARQ
jgi:AraC-like DNA-binding protein